MYGEIFNKFKRELPYTKDSVIARIIYECFERMELFDMDKDMLLDSDVTISVRSDTEEIDVRQDIMFGIFWSFDKYTGELVGT